MDDGSGPNIVKLRATLDSIVVDRQATSLALSVEEGALASANAQWWRDRPTVANVKIAVPIDSSIGSGPAILVEGLRVNPHGRKCTPVPCGMMSVWPPEQVPVPDTMKISPVERFQLMYRIPICAPEAEPNPGRWLWASLVAHLGSEMLLTVWITKTIR